jgi:hypothetical protein
MCVFCHEMFLRIKESSGMGELWCATFSVHKQGVDGTDWIPVAFSGHEKRK